MKKSLWVHGTYFIEFEGDFYHHNLTEAIWEERYLPYVSELTVCSRQKTAKDRVEVCRKMLSIPKADARLAFQPLRVHFVPKAQEKAQIRRLLSGVDMVIVRVPNWNSNIVAEQALHMGIPYMAEVVGCAWDAYFTHSLKGKLAAPAMELAMRKTVKYADYAIYVTRAFLQNRYPCRGKTLAWSDVQLEIPTASLREARLQKCAAFSTENRITLATIGAVDVHYKGQIYVLKALALLKSEGLHFRYKLIGGGDQTSLLQYAQNLGVCEMVEFTGNLTHEQVFAALDEVDVYVHPSLTEGLPRAVLEAEGRGCAVIGTRVGGMPEIVRKEDLFGKKDVRGIARLLRGFTAEKLMQEAQQNMDFVEMFLQENSAAVRDAFMKQVCADVEARLR